MESLSLSNFLISRPSIPPSKSTRSGISPKQRKNTLISVRGFLIAPRLIFPNTQSFNSVTPRQVKLSRRDRSNSVPRLIGNRRSKWKRLMQAIAEKHYISLLLVNLTSRVVTLFSFPVWVVRQIFSSTTRWLAKVFTHKPEDFIIKGVEPLSKSRLHIGKEMLVI